MSIPLLLIGWIALSIPAALFLGAFIRAGSGPDEEIADDFSDGDIARLPTALSMTSHDFEDSNG